MKNKIKIKHDKMFGPNGHIITPNFGIKAFFFLFGFHC